VSNGSTQPNREQSKHYIRTDVCNGIHNIILPHQVDRVIAEGRKGGEAAQHTNDQKRA
jgi:hypothetical protein